MTVVGDGALPHAARTSAAERMTMERDFFIRGRKEAE
jgi:hypothetical protein